MKRGIEKLNKISLLIGILIFLSSCEKEKKELEFEEIVMNEIFLDLVDSVFYDMRLMPPMPVPPPPPPGIEISDSLKKENLKRHQKILADFEKRKVEIEKDTSRIVIAVYDTIFTLSQEDYTTLKSNFKDSKLKIDTLKNVFDYKIDLSQFNKSKKFIFKYMSEFPDGSKIWKDSYPFYLGGAISLSQIYFDEKKEFGILEGGIIYGRLNGGGFRIFIKKLSEKWVIDKIEGTWVS